MKSVQRGMCAALMALPTVGQAAPPRDHVGITREAYNEADERGEALWREKDRARPRRADRAALPTYDHPSVHDTMENEKIQVGWHGALADPAFEDRRRRPWVHAPTPWGKTLQAGTKFVFDVEIAGNPAGQVEAFVASVDPDPHGSGPALARVQGHAVTSGVVSMLASATADTTTWVDVETGALVRSELVMTRGGMGASFKRRDVDVDFEGFGSIRLEDTRDGKTKTYTRVVPRGTVDDMTLLAWVRSLDIAVGESATRHVLDGKILMRFDVMNRGPGLPDPVPNIGRALGLKKANVNLYAGTLTRVNEWGEPIEGKRVFNIRIWVSTDPRRILLGVESDLWLGVIRLMLSRYDPPAE